MDFWSMGGLWHGYLKRISVWVFEASGIRVLVLKLGSIRVSIFSSFAGLGYRFLKHGWIRIWVFGAWGDLD